MADLTGNGYKDLILLARSVQHQYAMEEFSAKELRPILRALNKATAEIMREIKRRNDTTTRVWSKRVEDRNLKILNELENMTLGIREQLKEDISDVYVRAAEKSMAEHNAILSFDGAVVDTVGFNYVSLSKEQLMAIAIDVPVGGKLLSEWVDVAFTSQIQGRIREEVLTGVLKGEGTAKLVRRISQGFEGTRNEIISLVRTMVAEANNSAAEAVYRANSDIIEAVEWSAVLEVSLSGKGKTCPRCVALDGQTWPLGEYHPPIPLHPRCRCFMVVKTRSYASLGLNIPDLKKSARPYTIRNGIPIGTGRKKSILEVGNFTGDASKLVANLGDDYMLSTYGRGRYERIKAGKVMVKDLVDKQGRLIDVKDLPPLDKPKK